MGVVSGGVDEAEEDSMEREGTEVREETSWEGVRLERLCGLGGVPGEGVRVTEGEGLCPRRGLPVRDWARESRSCWAAVWVVEEEEGREGVAGEGVPRRPVSGEESS